MSWSWRGKKALNKAVLQTANLSKVVKRSRRKKEMSISKKRNEEEEDGEEPWRRRRTRRSVGAEQTGGEMEGEEGRNRKMNERENDKNSCF